MFDNLHEILEIKSKISKRFVILLQRNTTTKHLNRRSVLGIYRTSFVKLTCGLQEMLVEIVILLMFEP